VTSDRAGWFACEFPERPPEVGLTHYHSPDWNDAPCRGCFVALQATVALYPAWVGKSWGAPKSIANMLAEMIEAGWDQVAV
jgi:hypothetical protein